MTAEKDVTAEENEPAVGKVRRYFAVEANEYRKAQAQAGAIESRKRITDKGAQGKAQIASAMQNVLGVEPDTLETIECSDDFQADTTTCATYGSLAFTMSYGGYLRLVLPPCPSCGNERSVQVPNVRALYYALTDDVNHLCPDDPDFWLINKDVQEAAIAERNARREAYLAAQDTESGLAQIMDEVRSTPLEEVVVHLFRAIQAFTAYHVDTTSHLDTGD